MRRSVNDFVALACVLALCVNVRGGAVDKASCDHGGSRLGFIRGIFSLIKLEAQIWRCPVAPST